MSEPLAEFAESNASGGAKPGYWRLVALLMLVVAMGHFNRIAITVAGAERIIPSHTIDETNMGWVYSIFLLCYTLAMLPGGWCIDRFGPRAALMFLTFGSVPFVALTGLVGDVCNDPTQMWIGFLVVRSVLGVINSPLHPAGARAVFSHVPGSKKSLANGLVTFAACLGMASTYYGFGGLIDHFSWPTAFYISSGITLAVAIIWTVGTREFRGNSVPSSAISSEAPKKASRDPIVATPISRVLLHPGIVCLTIAYAALSYFQYICFYWVQYYFDTVEKLGKDVSRQNSTLVTLTMGIGMVLGGWLADRVLASARSRYGRIAPPALGMAGSGIALEIGLLSGNSQIMLAAFVVAAFLIGTCEGAYWTTVVQLGEPRGGLSAGLMNVGGNAGGTVAPILTPILAAYFGAHWGQSVGWRMSLSVGGIATILGAFLWLVVAARDDRPLTSPGQSV